MMRVIVNDNNGLITLADLNALDCVLIQSGLIGLLKHGNDTERIDRLIEICDPAVEIAAEIVLNEMADEMADEIGEPLGDEQIWADMDEKLPDSEMRGFFDY